MERSYSGNCNTVATKRWICFIAAIWLQSINGTNFVFSNYSSTLKDVMGINQIKLNNLAVASDLGKIMGWVSGVMCMFLPSWAVLGIAMTLGLVGYGGQWLMLTKIIPPLEYWQVYILCFLAGNSICWFNTVSFRTAIENFPTNRGIASGLTTSYSGLSAVIYTSLSSVVDSSNPSLYLLLNCIVPATVGTISAFLLHVSQSKIPNEEKTDEKYIVLVTVIAIVTAVYSILFGFLPHGKRGKEAIYMSVLIVLLVAPLYIPLKLAFGHRTKSKRVISCSSSPGVSPNNIPEIKQNPLEEEISNMKTLSTNEEIPQESKHCTALDIEQGKRTVERFETSQLRSAPSLGEEHGIRELLTSIDFWLYYLVYFCGGTVGLVYINNLGQILQSLGYSKTPILVSLVSAFAFFGRIASGFPDYIQQWKMTRNWRPLPRPGWIGIWMVPMIVAFFMLALLDTKGSILYVSTAIIGASSGAITSISIPISSELFGLQRFGVNHNILITNIALGSLLFGELAGIIYDDSSSKHGVEEQGRHICMGKQCFQKTFFLWGGVCSFGIVLCVILSARTRELYESIHRRQQTRN